MQNTFITRLTIGMGGIALATAVSMPVLAQGDIDSEQLAATDERNAAELNLDPVSITATRNPVAAFDYPGMVSVVDREEMDRRQPSSLDDVLGYLPGVQFTGGPRRTGEMPSIRGFSGADLVVLLDGARQNFLSGHSGRLFVDPSLLREAEVLRGSSSSLYGSGATGGVIELRTIGADDILGEDDTVGLRTSLGGQSVNREWNVTTTAAARPDENVGLLASVTRRASGRIDLGDGNTLTNTNDDIVSGMVKSNFTLGQYHNLEASALFFNNDAREPINGQGAGGQDKVEKSIRNRTFRLSYSYDNPEETLINPQVTAYYAENKVEDLRLDALGAGPEGERLFRRIETVGLRGENRSHFRFSENSDVTFTYGVEAHRDKQTGRVDGGPRESVPDAESDYAGAFLQGEFSFREPFGALPGEILLIPGLRYDYYKSSSDNAEDNKDTALSPRIGASYLPTDWSLLFASYGEAFRAPTFGELYPSGVHFQIPGFGVNNFIPNPDLEPQKTRTLEIGAGLDFKDIFVARDRFQIKGSRYWTKGKDFIDVEVVQPGPPACFPPNCNGTTQNVNVEDAKLSGNEIEASYDHPRFRLSANYADIDGENEETGEKLGVLFPRRVNLDGTLKLPEFDSFLGWRILAADDFDKTEDPAEERDGYVVHDLYAGWVPQEGPLEGLRIDFGIDNVFDKTYARTYTDAPEPGRNFKGMISYTLTW
ncbi:TonB-dependent receptor domain-containing protein [Fodinicurvata sediminis]|uniref:TonB-dependent receptor domain-containing protein n=1 Tax=Fodinicurvata sediminis TaxID=1121832 RepID=UPI000423E350|nr:TonB-dependent receptor [Fodinicurvata sediminis]